MSAGRRKRPPARYVKNPGRRQDQTRRAVDERRHKTAVLTRAGCSAPEIADQLGVDQRTVIRYRRQIREQRAREKQQYQLAS